MNRVGFLDNDIIHKLVAMNLFYPAIDALQIDRSNLQVLPTARYWFQGQKRKARLYSDLIWDAGIAVVNGCQSISPALDAAGLMELEYLQEFRNQIHEGEQRLILATQSTPDFLLLTGDKVCMTAMMKLKPEIYDRLSGRVICLEQIVLLLIQQLGFAVVLENVLPMRDVDTVLRACFGSGERSTERNVTIALDGYIKVLRQQAPGLLADIKQFERDI